jgi:hypothetical protein
LTLAILLAFPIYTPKRTLKPSKICCGFLLNACANRLAAFPDDFMRHYSISGDKELGETIE